MGVKRETIQKTIILKTVSKMGNHPTAEEVYQKINKEYPTISKGTVYRNLGLLSANKEISKLNLPNEPARYDFRTDNHGHFKCSSCGDIFDIEYEEGFISYDKLVANNGFSITSVEVTFQGLCNNCQKKLRRSEKSGTRSKQNAFNR